MEFDLENPFTNSHGLHFDTVPSLFLIESDHMPSQNYLKTFHAADFDISVRREAISSILQVSSNFDPIVSYLAINYLDRFLSGQGIPVPKPWVIRLLAVSCVSLAAKTKKTEFSLTDIQISRVLEFRPSIIAASVFLSASHVLFPLQFSCYRKALSICSYVNKESMLQCYNLFHDIAMKEYESVLGSDTPSNVLDGHFSSMQNIKTGETASSSCKRRAQRDETEGLLVAVRIKGSSFMVSIIVNETDSTFNGLSI